MKRLISLFAVCAVALTMLAMPARAPTQEVRTWSYTGLYELKSHRFSQVVLAPAIQRIDLGTFADPIPDVPKFHLAFNIAPLVGFGSTGEGTAGLAATLDPIALTADRKWRLVLGAYGRYENRTPIITGLLAGIQVDLGS